MIKSILIFLHLFYANCENVGSYLTQNRENIVNGKAITGLPRGTILMVSSREIDFWFNMLGMGLGEYQGWYLCDGRNGTPDLRGRFVVGRDAFNSQSDYSMNENKGGTSSFILTEANLPPHGHDFDGQTTLNGEHAHDYDDVTYADCYGGPGSVFYLPYVLRGIRSGDANNQACQLRRTSLKSGSHTHSFSGKTKLGSGISKPIDNRPPYSVVTYIIYKGI